MNKKRLAIIILLFFVFLGSLYYFTQINKKPVVERARPTPAPIAPFEASPSAWAKDKVVLKIEQDLARLEKDLDDVDLDEPHLRLPILDLKVKY